MSRRLGGAAPLVVVALFAAGCGGEGEEAAGGPCATAPAAIAQTPALPAGFPTPEGVVYTSERDAGPSHIVEGLRDGDLESAFEAYKDGFDAADGYDVTKDEKEDHDAEVNFAGGSSTGQVKLLQACDTRTSITVTVRPE
jgi:hypothetical protein